MCHSPVKGCQFKIQNLKFKWGAGRRHRCGGRLLDFDGLEGVALAIGLADEFKEEGGGGVEMR